MNRELTTQERITLFATTHLGLQEIVGKKNNPLILGMFAEIGHSWVKNDETAWCSCFANYVALKVGVSRSGKLDARSWLSTGNKTELPKHGDVVVFWRESPDSWKGHVGFFMGYTSKGDIYCLGGNQQNEVNISVYPKERLLGFRVLL